MRCLKGRILAFVLEARCVQAIKSFSNMSPATVLQIHSVFINRAPALCLVDKEAVRLKSRRLQEPQSACPFASSHAQKRRPGRAVCQQTTTWEPQEPSHLHGNHCSFF